MADPGDLLRAWQEVIRQLRGAAAPLTSQSDLGRQLLAPLERQAELLEHALLRQTEFELAVVGRLLTPVRVLLEMLDQTSAAMRTQAQALDAAAVALKQASELLEQQATLLERAGSMVRDPTDLLRFAGGTVKGKEAAPEEG